MLIGSMKCTVLHRYSEHRYSEHSCGEHRCGEHKCDEHRCGEQSCGEHMCGEHRCGEHMCGEHRCGVCADRCAGCEALLQNLETQVTSANSRKEKESKIALQMEQEV